MKNVCSFVPWAAAIAIALSLATAGCFDPESTEDSGGTSGGTAEDTTSGGTETASTSASTTTTMTTTSTSNDTSTSTTDPDTGTTEGPPVCDSRTHECVEPAPAGWNGPVTILASTPPDAEPSCVTDYPEYAVTAFAGLSAPDANCTCECDPPNSVTCSSVNFVPYGDNSCQCNPFCAANTVNSTCTNINGSTGWWQAHANLPNGTQCVVNDSEQLPTAAFAERYTACGGAIDTGGCADDLACLPSAPDESDGRICVYAEGDMQCPAGEYSDRIVYHRDHEDNRSCTTCSCGDAEGNCTGNVTIRDSQCGGLINNQQNIPANVCTQTNFSFSSATWNQNGFDVTCPPSGGQPTGDATPIDPVTVCCR